MPSNPMLDAALEYLARGWSVVPVCPPDHAGMGTRHRETCSSPGKAAAAPWKSFQSHLPTEYHLRSWWGEYGPWRGGNPAYNVGVVLGRVSGLVGVDADGPANLPELRRRASASRVGRWGTLWFQTARGLRLLYATEAGERVASRLLWESRAGDARLELLAEGHMTVMPPSRHASGAVYAWGCSPKRRPAPLPDWLRPQPATPKRQPVALSPPTPACTTGVVQPIPEGRRHVRLFKAACAVRRHGATEGEIRGLVLAMNARCVPPLLAGELEGIVARASRYSPAVG